MEASITAHIMKNGSLKVDDDIYLDCSLSDITDYWYSTEWTQSENHSKARQFLKKSSAQPVTEEDPITK